MFLRGKRKTAFCYFGPSVHLYQIIIIVSVYTFLYVSKWLNWNKYLVLLTSLRAYTEAIITEDDVTPVDEVFVVEQSGGWGSVHQSCIITVHFDTEKWLGDETDSLEE